MLALVLAACGKPGFLFFFRQVDPSAGQFDKIMSGKSKQEHSDWQAVVLTATPSGTSLSRCV